MQSELVWRRRIFKEEEEGGCVEDDGRVAVRVLFQVGQGGGLKVPHNDKVYLNSRLQCLSCLYPCPLHFPFFRGVLYLASMMGGMETKLASISSSGPRGSMESEFCTRLASICTGWAGDW